MTISESFKISTVEGSSAPNPFPGKGEPPREGAQYPKTTGIQPVVLRADTEPILPRGMMGSSEIVDESVNGESVNIEGIN